MIFDVLIKLLIKVPSAIFKAIPNVSISDIPIPYNYTEWLENMLMYSRYFFPMELVCYIISTMLELRLLRIQIASWKFIKSNIPLFGGL